MYACLPSIHSYCSSFKPVLPVFGYRRRFNICLGGVVFVLSGGLRHNYVSLFSPGAATGSSHPRGVLFNIRDLKIDVYGKPPSNRILTSTVRCSNLCAFDQS